MDAIRFALLGLGTGAVIASVALGLVLTYRASGVVNFAQGAMASWSVYTFYSLTDNGSIPLLPFPFVPESLSLGGPWPVAAALLASLAVAGVLGLAVYLLIFRPLRSAPALAKIAAAVGVMLTLQAALAIRFGFRDRSVPAVVPDSPVDWFGIRMGVDRYILLLVVVVLTAALGWLFARTRIGLSVRAAAEDERSASFVGISADRLAAITWTLASVLAALVGVLAAAITGLTPTLLSLVIVPALAAALVAGFRSFAIAAVVGIGIGVVQSLILLAEVRVDGWPPISLGTALPFAVIAAVMLITGRGLPERGSVDISALPTAHAPRMVPPRIVAYAAFVVLIIVAVVFAPFEVRAALNASMLGTLVALSLVVVTGFAGQISLAQMVLAGLSAFTVATLGTDAGLGLLITLPLAMVVAVLAGLLLGIPSLRTRGASLAILTLAAGVAVQQIVLTRDGWFGAATSRSAPAPTLFGVELGPRSPFPFGDGTIPSPAFGLLLATVTVIACLIVMRLRRTPLGIQMLTVRANERAAASAGVNVTVIKFAAFGIAAGLAGIGGAMTAYGLGSFTAKPFDVIASLVLLAVAYLGGISTIGGAVWAGSLAAGGIFVIIQQRFYEAGQYSAYVAGLGLLLTVVLYPQGIDGATRNSTLAALAWLRRRVRPHRELVAGAE